MTYQGEQIFISLKTFKEPIPNYVATRCGNYETRRWSNESQFKQQETPVSRYLSVSISDLERNCLVPSLIALE